MGHHKAGHHNPQEAEFMVGKDNDVKEAKLEAAAESTIDVAESAVEKVVDGATELTRPQLLQRQLKELREAGNVALADLRSGLNTAAQEMRSGLGHAAKELRTGLDSATKGVGTAAHDVRSGLGTAITEIRESMTKAAGRFNGVWQLSGKVEGSGKAAH